MSVFSGTKPFFVPFLVNSCVDYVTDIWFREWGVDYIGEGIVWGAQCGWGWVSAFFLLRSQLVHYQGDCYELLSS